MSSDSTFTSGAEKGTGADLQAGRSGLGMKVLSVRAPWWWWIVYGGKDIENRDWFTDYRGPVAIHASKWWTKVGFDADWESARAMERKGGKPMVGSGLWCPNKIRGIGGHIVGVADIVDCVSASDSPWFVGKFGFVLANARPVTPILCKGALGFFTAPPDVLAALRRESDPTAADTPTPAPTLPLTVQRPEHLARSTMGMSDDDSGNETHLCSLCGEPMPPGEPFRYHGYSCDCPKPPLARTEVMVEYIHRDTRDGEFWIDIRVQRAPFQKLGPFATKEERQRVHDDLLGMTRSLGAKDFPSTAEH